MRTNGGNATKPYVSLQNSTITTKTTNEVQAEKKITEYTERG